MGVLSCHCHLGMIHGTELTRPWLSVEAGAGREGGAGCCWVTQLPHLGLCPICAEGLRLGGLPVVSPMSSCLRSCSVNPVRGTSAVSRLRRQSEGFLSFVLFLMHTLNFQKNSGGTPLFLNDDVTLAGLSKPRAL